MNKRIAFALLLIVTLSLAGCQGAEPAAGAGTGTAASLTPGATLPEARPGGGIMNLALGILQLDGTEQAIGEAQAAELLPLWKAYLALMDADSTAPEELAALVNQIRASFTEEQLAALEGEPLDGEAQQALAARFGFEMPAFAQRPVPGAEGDAASADAAAGDQAPMGVAGGALEGPGMAPGMAPSGEGGARRGAGMGPGMGGGLPDGGVPPDWATELRTRASEQSSWISDLLEAVIAYLQGLA